MKTVLTDLLRKRLEPAAWGWMEKALASARPPVHANSFLGYYSGASRRAGKRALELDAVEEGRVRDLDPALDLSAWGADEAARALLLLTAGQLPPDEFADLAIRCYELGDSREQQSWLRALAMLPRPERFVSVAIDACRTNILPLFEAIACENPYPERHFPELNFNQMVLKALFNSVALCRIGGLERRAGAELSRMSFDYLCEREAAGRSVPADIWLALMPHLESGSMPRALRYLEEGSPEQRYWLAVALGLRRSSDSKAALETHCQSESDPRVADAMRAALQKL